MKKYPVSLVTGIHYTHKLLISFLLKNHHSKINSLSGHIEFYWVTFFSHRSIEQSGRTISMYRKLHINS